MAKQNRSRKENLSEEAYKKKLEYNKQRNKKLKNYTFIFQKGSPEELWVSSQHNKRGYIISLIEADMKK